jgi:hypothetical protein
MKKLLCLFFSIGGFALIGHAWLSAVLSTRVKMILTVIGIAMISLAAVAQWKWSTPSE